MYIKLFNNRLMLIKVFTFWILYSKTIAVLVKFRL